MAVNTAPNAGLPPSTVVYRSRRPIRKQASSLTGENCLHCNDPSNCNVWNTLNGGSHVGMIPIWVLPSQVVGRYDSRPFAPMPWPDRVVRPGQTVKLFSEHPKTPAFLAVCTTQFVHR
jgi:hypothetical protein